MLPALINKYKLLLLYTLLGVAVANAQTFQWAKRIGNTPSAGQDVRASTTDASGNIYITGLFWGTVDFDPDAGTFNLISNSGSQDIYVCKLNPLGNFVWAKSFVGSMPDWPLSITVDASSNVLVAGLFQGTVDFDPGAAVLNITSLGGTDGFVTKLSNAGNLVWVRRYGSTGVDRCNSVITDAGGNVYISGSYAATFDADPDPPVFNIGGTSSFLIKVNSAGLFIWGRSIEGMSPIIAMDGSSNIYITGQFSGSEDFDPLAATFTLTSAGALDVFVCKFNSAGAFVWAKRIGGTANEMAAGIAVDAAGNVHTIGSFDDVCDFDPGAATYNLTSTAGGMALDMFISKLNTSGNFVWAKRIGGPNGTNGTAIDLDASGNVYTTGAFAGTVDFNPGTAINNLVAASNNEAFILKLSSAGNYVWAYDLSATTGVNGLSITIDFMGGIIASGAFSGTGDFNPYSGVSNLTSNGNFNVYVLKLYVSPLPIELLSFNATQNKNTVDIRWQTASETNNDFFTLERSKEGNNFEEFGKVTGAGNSNTLLSYSYTDTSPFTDISYYRIKQTDFNGDFSYSATVPVRLTNCENEFRVYYSAADYSCFVNYYSTSTFQCNIVISDLTGKVLLLEKVNVNEGMNNLIIVTSILHKGMYVIGMQNSFKLNLASKFTIN